MRALALHATGGITLQSIKDAEDKPKKRLALPSMILAVSEKEKDEKVKRRAMFSSTDWAKPTASFYRKCVNKITDEKMASIIAKAKEVSRASRQQAREEVDAYDPDDSIAMLGDGSEASSSEHDMQLDAPSSKRDTQYNYFDEQVDEEDDNDDNPAVDAMSVDGEDEDMFHHDDDE